jgi:CRP-like cAMP-binding protein
MIASDYVESYRDLHLAASYLTASQRVALVLNSLATAMGERIVEGTVLNIRNEELANEANVTIFTVSRLLSEWQRKGLLVKSRGRIVIRSSEALVRNANRVLPIARPEISSRKIAREQRWNEIQGASL